MKYCKVCGEDISRRGNRATKCEFCQRKDTLLEKEKRIIEDLGSPNADKPNARVKFCKKSVSEKLVSAHKNAILPEDNTDTRQNVKEIERRKEEKRSRREVYKEWKYGCI